MSSEVESSSLKEEAGGAEDANHPTSSWDGQKKNLPGTPTPERPPSSASSGSSASDDTCSICLGHVTDKCVADSCLHSFCLVCLKEWSKQKAVCPLCKLSFTKIMYEIKSESDYKEWMVPQPDPGERNQGIANFQEFLNAETRRFFGYRTTHFPGAATLRRMHVGRPISIPDAIPSLPPQRRSRYNLRGSTMFRLSVYLNNIWVQPLADITGRYRQTSPQLYREQPALTHRLVPWVNRELAALISPSRVGTVLTEVMDLIERYAIDSPEFRVAMQPHLERRTRHFVHEFYHFARSPYDMVGHDNAAQYVPRYGHDDSSSDIANSDDDSDAVIEVDSTGNPIPSTSTTEGGRGQSAPGNVAREETLTQEGSVVISSSESSESENEISQPQDTDPASYELTHNPEPPLTAMRRLIGRAMDFFGNVNEGASTSRFDGASGRNANRVRRPYSGASSDHEDSDGCIIVEEVVPRAPTPELIEIDSDREHSSPQNGNESENSPAKQSKKVRGKSKPKLKRNNFIGAEDSNRDCSVGDCNAAQQDHSYCTEDGSLGALPSTSSTDALTLPNGLDNPCSSSQEISQNEQYPSDDPSFSDESETKEVVRNVLSSNDSQAWECSVKVKGKHKSTDKRKCNVRDSSAEGSSRRSRKRKLSSDSKGSSKLSKKDLKSKIKCSLFPSPSRVHSDERKRSANRYQKVVRESSSDSSRDIWLPHSKKARSAGPTGHGQHDECTSSEESCSEPKSSHHHSSTKYRISSKTRKSSKKRRRKSKEKHREKVKRSSKKKKHKKKSKSKKHECWYRSDSEWSERKRHRTRSGHKKKRSTDASSDSESSSSYVKYKETTVKVRILDNNSSSSYSSDTYP